MDTFEIILAKIQSELELDPFPERILVFAETRHGKKYTKRCLTKLNEMYPDMIFSHTLVGYRSGVRWYKNMAADVINTEPAPASYQESNGIIVATGENTWMSPEEIKRDNSWCFGTKYERNAYRNKLFTPGTQEHMALKKTCSYMDAFILTYQELKASLEDIHDTHAIKNHIRNMTEDGIRLY